MEAQTLQQQVPVYHVCQQCNGAGCQACSDLLILDGDIQLDPEWNDELPEPSPINGVIGVTPIQLSASNDVKCHGCPYVGPAISFDIINYADSEVDYLICPVCSTEFVK